MPLFEYIALDSEGVEVKDQIDSDMISYVAGDLSPAAKTATEDLRRSLPDYMENEIDIQGRTLSPSDFGFHNAIRRDDGELIFLDFEYFGWDDPAKMISDFVLHPAMELSPSLKARFVANTAGGNPVLMERLETVFPLFGLKWCLILLNLFLPQYRFRRGLDEPASARLFDGQLEKARLMLSTVERGHESFPYKDGEHTVNVT